MPTPMTHAVVALAAGKAYTGKAMPARFWLTAMACSALPDLDVVGFAVGIRYGDLLGHRGLSHSLLFALVVGFAGATVVLPWAIRFSRRWWRMGAFFALLTASHGLLDAMTNGGLGIAFFSPFDSARYFLPFRPLTVAPIGVGAMFSRWGGQVLLSEIVWVWIPAAAMAAAATVCRVGIGKTPAEETD